MMTKINWATKEEWVAALRKNPTQTQGVMERIGDDGEVTGYCCLTAR